jgi:hypothetical protein
MNTRTMLSASALVVCLAASFGAPASERYAVSAKLTHQGTAFASPTAVVRGGEPATMHMSGPNEFKLALTVKEGSAGKIEVAAAINSQHGKMAPTVVVEPGVPASVQVGDLGLTLTVNRSGG